MQGSGVTLTRVRQGFRPASMRVRAGTPARTPAAVAAEDPVSPQAVSGARAGLVLLPFLVMAAVAAVDVLAGPKVGFLPLLSLGPALAAVSLRPLQTVLVGGLAMGLSVLLAGYDDRLGSHRLLVVLAAIAGVTATGVIASAGRGRRERELASVRAVAEAAQRVLLRPVPAHARQTAFAVRYMSAAATALIGGDLYEIVVTPETVRIIVGDVQGKGLAAVQTASVVLGAFRETAYDAGSLDEIAARIELSLERQGSAEEFVTAVLAQLSPGGIEILNCGHPPPLLISGGSAVAAEPPEAGVPLGLSDFAMSARKPSVFPLGEGDRVLFYTDGISEARNKAGAFFPLERSVGLLDGPDAEAALDRVCGAVIEHVGHELQDDAALLLVMPGPRVAPSDQPA